MIVVEGQDLLGKSTLAQKLSEYLCIPYNPNAKDFPELFRKKYMNIAGLAWLSQLRYMKDYNCIIDRAFISNLVYDEFFKREVPFDEKEEILKYYNEIKPTILYLYTNDIELIKERNKIRHEDCYDASKDENLLKLKSLFDKYSSLFEVVRLEIVREDTPESVLEKALNALDLRTTSEHIIKTQGKKVNVWSNYRNKYTETIEALWTTSFVNIENVKSYDYEDYGIVKEKLQSVIDMFKKEPTRRDAVIVNPIENACIVFWQFFIRDNQIKCGIFNRSSLDKKIQIDLGYTKLFLEKISEQLEIPYDPKVFFSQSSAHIEI